MTNIYLVRHAQSEANIGACVGGRTPLIPLSAEGVHQAMKLRFRDWPDCEAYTSTALRCKTTALLAGFNCIEDERLVEISRGEWEGKPYVECYTPELKKWLKKNPENSRSFKAPGGETLDEVADRLESWLNDQRGKENVVGFTHCNSIKSLIYRILDCDPRRVYDLKIENTGVTHLVYKNHWCVLNINDDSHLKFIER